MKISASTITYLMRSGYMTLQVPQYTIRLGNEPVPERDEIDVPDEWFMETKHQGGLWSENERQCVGRERGYTHLSPIGWAANREAIRAAWEDAKKNPRGDMRRLPDDRRSDTVAWENGTGREWSDFEAWVARWFEKISAGLTRELVKTEERARALRVAAAKYELQRRG